MRESSAAQASSSSSRVPGQAGPVPQGMLSWRSPSAARSSAAAFASPALGSLPGARSAGGQRPDSCLHRQPQGRSTNSARSIHYHDRKASKLMRRTPAPHSAAFLLVEAETSSQAWGSLMHRRSTGAHGRAACASTQRRAAAPRTCPTSASPTRRTA